MSADIQNRSATIYEFPAGGRSAAKGAGSREETKRMAALAAMTTCEAAFGAGWYHDAAIRDSDKPGKH